MVPLYTCQETVAVFSFRSVSASMLYGHIINGADVSENMEGEKERIYMPWTNKQKDGFGVCEYEFAKAVLVDLNFTGGKIIINNNNKPKYIIYTQKLSVLSCSTIKYIYVR